ncbi:polymer-forming cytoskeletal protein [Halorubrum halophilum]|uniref:polymer-forming cytoskeletal protein n=1 Tax=Halorubrum halophilum TaxID=413816 RepID=UPI000678AFBA|nr:polymer-forming cytoskeletal protein [Halorubrum halophilum]
MRFSRDRRGQSVVVGTVILFGFLILAMATYQVQFVPTENAEIEFEHSQQVEGEFLDLRNAVLNTGQSDNNRLTSLTLGTRYPQRTFFLNPPPATGELSTSEQQSIRIESATVAEDGNVGLFWEDRDLTFPTKSVRYSPSYNEYRNPPDLVYEHSMVVADFDGAALSRTGQTVINNDADRISLTLVDGTLSESGIERREIDPEALSRNARSMTLEPDGGEVVIVLPTAVPEGEKRDDLASGWNETFESGVDRTVTATPNGIRIEIRTGNSVELRLAQVGVGSGTDVTDESGGYITKVSESNGEFVAEVRDQFNNPVEGAEVEVYADTGETSPMDNSPRITDESGQVTISDRGGTVGTINGAPPDEAGTDRVVFDEFTPPTVPTGSVYGPDVSGTTTNPSTVQQGNSFNLEASVSSIGDSSRIRSGTPIQTVRVTVGNDDAGTVYDEMFTFDPDDNTREYAFGRSIQVDNWDPGTYDVTVSGQDASGRWTAEDEVGTTTVTVREGDPPGSVNFVATDVVKGGNSQEFVFTVDGLSNNDQATIDLSGPQSDGVDYTDGAVELIERTNPNDAVSYDPSTNTITYTKRGGGAGEVRIRISNIDVTGNAGETYVVGYEDGNIDSDTFEIRPPGTTIITQDTDDVSANGDIVIEDNVVIDGDVDSQNGEVIVGENADIDGDANANGDIVIGDGAFVAGVVDSENGGVTVGDNAEIDDDVSANGDIVIGDETFIDGDVDSQNGTVSLGSGTQVTGSVNANGNVDFGVGSLVEGDVTSQNGRVTLEDGSEVEGDVNVNSASDIVCGQGSRIDGQPCEEYVDENY